HAFFAILQTAALMDFLHTPSHRGNPQSHCRAHKILRGFAEKMLAEARLLSYQANSLLYSGSLRVSRHSNHAHSHRQSSSDAWSREAAFAQRFEAWLILADIVHLKLVFLNQFHFY